MEDPLLMARPRKNAQQQQQLHTEDAALLPSSPLPFLFSEDDLEEAPAEEKNADNKLLPPLFPHHHHHHGEHHLHRHHFVKPSARLSAFLIIAVLGTFFVLPSLLSSSSTLRDGGHEYSSYEDYYAKDSESSDFTLGGLLAKDSDTLKCRSKGMSHRLRVKSPYSPSSNLVNKLREYEALHQRCGPGTERFNKSVNNLDLGLLKDIDDQIDDECKYVVWVAYSGLGNRLVSIASAFVYALLTQRVLVLDGRSDLSELLCEPFPGKVSWFLPHDFAALSSVSLNQSSPHKFGLHLRQGTLPTSIREPPEEDRKSLFSSLSASRPSPRFSYIHLGHDYDFFDKLFFCDAEQKLLSGIPWLFLRSNLYFVPSMYLYIPEFQQELNRLFPEPEAIFHHISRYLFFPTNSVWSRIMRFYNAYLGQSSQIVGVQIRSFVHPPVVNPHLTKQILRCGEENGLLPKIASAHNGESLRFAKNSTAVLVTSLLPDYSEQLKQLYADNATETGEVVSVHQPSHEMQQNTEAHAHNLKAWAEICLLSFSHKLITSPISTFGYVAQGLAGIKPWVLTATKNGDNSSSACSQVLSMEPCFHAPPYYNCDGSKGDDTSKVVPYVRHCEDIAWGLKAFPRTLT